MHGRARSNNRADGVGPNRRYRVPRKCPRSSLPGRGRTQPTAGPGQNRIVPDVQPDYLGWFSTMAGDAPRRPDYVGLRRSDAIELARQDPRLAVRTLDLDALQDDGPRRMWTADGRRDRLNIVISDGIVVAAAMF
jgi:hypothetical protein